MDIYKKLPLDIRLYIIDIFRKDDSNKLLKEIKKRRHQYICQQIYQYKPDLNNYDKYLDNNTLLYYWLNIYNININMGDYPGNFFARFLNRVFPELVAKDNNLNTVFFYYKRKYIGNYQNFIDLILEKLETDEIEDLYNWIDKETKYGTGLINYSSISRITYE